MARAICNLQDLMHPVVRTSGPPRLMGQAHALLDQHLSQKTSKLKIEVGVHLTCDQSKQDVYCISKVGTLVQQAMQSL